MFKSLQRNKASFGKTAQTFVEYSLLIGIIVAVLVAMTPLIRRSTQSMIKLVADQVGNQVNSEQKKGEGGYLASSYSNISTDMRSGTTERLGIIEYNYNDRSTTGAATTSNLGFSQK